MHVWVFEARANMQYNWTLPVLCVTCVNVVSSLRLLTPQAEWTQVDIHTH